MAKIRITIDTPSYIIWDGSNWQLACHREDATDFVSIDSAIEFLSDYKSDLRELDEREGIKSILIC